MKRRISRATAWRIAAPVVAIPLLAWGLGLSSASSSASVAIASPIHHVVIIMEENHSFDNYFGTFPGANGIPSGVCVDNPATGGCSAPYHLTTDYTHDLPHNAVNVPEDIDDGKMDGFIKSEQESCGCKTDQSMGYVDAEDIPVFWRYAEDYTLSDDLFDSVASWSYPSHLGLVSDWSALCTSPTNPMSCTGSPYLGTDPFSAPTWPANSAPWTDITWLLHRYGVSWSYYVSPGTEPDCSTNPCTTGQQAGTPSMWNPLPWFEDVQQDGQLGDIKDVHQFYKAAKTGNLPEVSWIVPNLEESGHPQVSTNADSEPYVVSLINAIESSPDWKSTAIFLAWDDWGGEYDHVVPPVVDANGFGLRVPSILISPYAKKGYVDPQLMSFDSYNKFVEDNFLGGQRIDPKTDGRPDSRTSVREALPILGSFMNDFDFDKPPAAPILLPVLTLPAKVVPGQAVAITGANFKPGASVTVSFDCDAPDCTGAVRMAPVIAGSRGQISETVTVPSSLPSGDEYVSALGANNVVDFAVTQTKVKSTS